jgi:hypothetical protein
MVVEIHTKIYVYILCVYIYIYIYIYIYSLCVCVCVCTSSTTELSLCFHIISPSISFLSYSRDKQTAVIDFKYFVILVAVSIKTHKVHIYKLMHIHTYIYRVS